MKCVSYDRRAIETSKTLIKRFRDIHGNKYDYSKCYYENSHEKMEMVCPEHGSFWQSSLNHLAGQGCVLCSRNNRVKNDREYYFDKNLKKFEDIHGDKYDYSKAVYKGVHEKIQIICKEHGSFWQTPSNHIYGMQGCPDCSKSPWNYQDKTTYLYYVLINDFYYKIGITSREIEERFRHEPAEVKVIYKKVFETGIQAYNIEQDIISSNYKFRYKGAPILKSGNSEIFTKDILKNNKGGYFD